MFIMMGVIVFIPLIIISIFLLCGRGASLIAGYNTMNKEKKAFFDEKALCRATGAILLAVAMCFALIPIGIYLEVSWITWFAAVLTVALPVGFAVYANTGKRFLKDKSAATPVILARNTRAAKVGIIITVVISAMVLIAVGVLLSSGASDPSIRVVDDGVQIKSLYGRTVELTKIANIFLFEKSMDEIGPGRRTNGFGGFGHALKGHFRSENLGDIMLYVQSKSSPTIWINCEGERDVYISLRDSEQTRTLYSELIAAYKLR